MVRVYRSLWGTHHMKTWKHLKRCNCRHRKGTGARTKCNPDKNSVGLPLQEIKPIRECVIRTWDVSQRYRMTDRQIEYRNPQNHPASRDLSMFFLWLMAWLRWSWIENIKQFLCNGASYYKTLMWIGKRVGSLCKCSGSCTLTRRSMSLKMNWH